MRNWVGYGIKLLVTVGAGWLGLWIPGVNAQIPTPILPQEPEPLPIPIPQPSPPAPEFHQTPAVPLAPAPRTTVPGTIRVDRFEFLGNTAFSDRDLAAVVQSFTGREISFGELLQAEAAITQKYVEAGYVNSGAVIPANQTLSPEGAVVKIQVVEGGLEAIEVTGMQRLNPDYVRSRLAIATQPPLNRDRLLEALQLLQLDPLIANVAAELQAGSRPEQSRLEVRVKEANSLRIELFADNNRSPSVGEFRRGMRINEANILGLGDGVEVSYSNTEGSNAVDVKYTLPINPQNGTLQVAGSLTGTRVVESPFDRIDITGNARTYELTYRQPIMQHPSQELALGLTVSRQETETFLLGEPFPLSPGASSQGEIRLSALRFFQEYVQRDSQQVLAARSQFTLGVGWLDATVNPTAPDSRFFAWRGQAQYANLLAPETLLILRSDLQLSANPLLGLEQIGIGGDRSVRGYRQDLLLTDNGVTASAELRIPILRVSEVRGVLQVAPFIDAGWGWNTTGISTGAPSDNLLGVGLGLLWQMDDRLSARLDYGIPLINARVGDRTLQDQGLYFSISIFPL